MSDPIRNPSTMRPILWRRSERPLDYPEAVSAMEARVAAIAAGEASELVWLVTHPPIYTAGTSANEADLIDAERFPVYPTGRGGQYTYHGPGQRVAYVMIDVRQRFGGDVRAFVCTLEKIVIGALTDVGIRGEIREGRVGVWVERQNPDGTPREDKIAALGVRIRRGISFHGIAVNIAPDLSHFAGIVPCGIAAHGVTSLADLGKPMTMAAFDEHLLARFAEVFGTLDREKNDAAA